MSQWVVRRLVSWAVSSSVLVGSPCPSPTTIAMTYVQGVHVTI